MSEQTVTLQIRDCLDRLAQGDQDARNELLRVAGDRLVYLAHRMLGDFPRLKGKEETFDVSQNAMLRLWKALEQVNVSSPREFFGLAATQIRRELLDLIRFYFGRSADSAGRDGVMKSVPAGEDSDAPAIEPGTNTLDPAKIAPWAEFHEAVEALPEDERELIGLLYYQELTQKEVAEMYGVDESTIKRRWRALRLKLAPIAQGCLT